MKFAVIVDAGSSGSRAFIYSWPDPDSYASSLGDSPAADMLLPVRSDPQWVVKQKPGISSFVGNSSAIWKHHLSPLLEKANKYIPKEKHHETPFFFLATAGLRLVPVEQRNEILQKVCDLVRTKTRFYVPECATHVTMIDGQTEGLYGWLGLNYLVHDSVSTPWDNFSETYGFMDMGGGSAQIAFVPNTTEVEKHKDDLIYLKLRTVRGNPVEWPVFVTTWLGFGANTAQRQYRRLLVNQTSLSEIVDPLKNGQLPIIYDHCLQAGAVVKAIDRYTRDDTPEPFECIFLGTGDFSACQESLLPLLNLDIPCRNEPCLFDGVHVPAFDLDSSRFVGVSEYWYTAQDILKLNGKFDYETYTARVQDLCQRSWSGLEQDFNAGQFGNIDKQNLEAVCFKSSWVLSILHQGFKLPLRSSSPSEHHNFLDTFQSAGHINGAEISWTLGRAVLYASSYIAPVAEPGDDPSPVGFHAWEEPLVYGGELPDSPPTIATRSNDSFYIGVFAFILLLGILFHKRITSYIEAKWKGGFLDRHHHDQLPTQETAPPGIELKTYGHQGLSTVRTPSLVLSRVNSRLNLGAEFP